MAPSPVAGTVVEKRRVRGPAQPYAASFDVVTVIDTGSLFARILHVNTTVNTGDNVTIGEPLGPLIRSGYFGSWVDNHVHLEYRPRNVDMLRASGSVPLDLDVPVIGQRWDGRGRISEVSESYVRVRVTDARTDMPGLVGVSTDAGSVLDGGLAHYATGGVHGDRCGGAVRWEGSTLGSPAAQPDRPRLGVLPWSTTVSLDGQPARGVEFHLVQHGGLEVTVVEPIGEFSLDAVASVGVADQAASSTECS